MLVVIIVVILLVSAMSDWQQAENLAVLDRNEEMRHQELISSYEAKSKQNRTVKRTRAVKEPSGRVLVEEVLLEGEFDEELDEELEY